MPYTDIALYMVIIISVVETAHLRGGSISWLAVSPTLINTTTVTINIEQTYSWSYSFYPCGLQIGDANNVMCISSNCSNYNSTLVGTQTPCTNFDLSLGISTGHSSTSITLSAGSQLVLAYRRSNWLQLVSSSSGSWSIITSIDLRVRTDNGRINSAPTASMLGLITVPIGMQQTLRVPLADVDFDIVKCRWANNTAVISSTVIDECGGVCQNIPGAQLYSTLNTNNNCTIVFTGTLVGYYVVTLQIEDFMPSNSSGSPLSSTALQFLILALNISCSQPIIIGQLSNEATIDVEANKIFTMSVFAQPGCNTVVINNFSTIVQPSGIVNMSPLVFVGSMLYSIQFTWTPTLNLIGSTQVYCTLATDSNNLQSTEYCLNFIVLGNATTLSTTTITQVVTTTQTTYDLSLVLGLGLSLALLLLLSSVLLSACCCWYPGFFWKKSQQQQLSEEQNVAHLQDQSPRLHQPVINVSNTYEPHQNFLGVFQPKYHNNIVIAPMKLSIEDFSGNYRQQYVKDNRQATPHNDIPTQITSPVEQLYSSSLPAILLHSYLNDERLIDTVPVDS